MDRAEILDTAKAYVTKDRAATHGDAERNFETIAAMWSAYLGAPVEAHDVAAMMVLLKVSRVKSNPGHADNWVDGAGYFACGGEIATVDDMLEAPGPLDPGISHGPLPFWKSKTQPEPCKHMWEHIADSSGPHFQCTLCGKRRGWGEHG